MFTFLCSHAVTMAGIGDWFSDTLSDVSGAVTDSLGGALQTLLYNYIYVIFYYLEIALLKIVSVLESVFEVFAGISKVSYDGGRDYLLNIFFNNDVISTIFWGMALLAMVLCFLFCAVAVTRKTFDMGERVRQSIGQILGGFAKAMLTILLLSACVIAALSLSNVLLQRVNYLILNAEDVADGEDSKTFSDEEFAAMARILNTVANYAQNPSSSSRYNINSCFNAIRADMNYLAVGGFFDFYYQKTESGSDTWQSALQSVAQAADLTRDLPLDVYNEEVATAITGIMDNLQNNAAGFKPIQSVTRSTSEFSRVNTDTVMFLMGTLTAANNDAYNKSSNITDPIRSGYYYGEKSYTDLDTVKLDFDISIMTMDYLVVYIAAALYIVMLTMITFQFIVRIFNLLLLYVSAPLFVSTMPLDDGQKFKSWTEAFVIQLFGCFGTLIAMRLYLMYIPIVMSGSFVLFDNTFVNMMGKLLLIIGGSWACFKANSLITGILAGNPGMAAITAGDQSGQAALGAMTRLASVGMKAASIGAKVATAPVTMPLGAFMASQGFTPPNLGFAGAGGAMWHASEYRSDRAAKLQERQEREENRGANNARFQDNTPPPPPKQDASS